MCNYLLMHSGHNTMNHQLTVIDPQIILAMLFCILFISYIVAVIYSNRRFKKWPIYRLICWVFAMSFALLAVIGPLADSAHTNFTAHMVSHLLLSMLVPIFMALATPMTLILRTLSTPLARRTTKLLKSRALQIISHPITATILNIGGLWLLYTTNLYGLMHENAFFALFVHIHFFIAGYLFTVSFIYFDPVFHHYSYRFRTIVLVVALSWHDILSKYMYAHPPIGVTQQEAEIGSMVMYYAGDFIDAILIVVFCWQWYKSVKLEARPLLPKTLT